MYRLKAKKYSMHIIIREMLLAVVELPQLPLQQLLLKLNIRNKSCAGAAAAAAAAAFVIVCRMAQLTSFLWSIAPDSSVFVRAVYRYRYFSIYQTIRSLFYVGNSSRYFSVWVFYRVKRHT